jgi:SAM-dependent methyltransferase
MSDTFGPQYAATYDAIYHSKDYAAECDTIERLFEQHAAGAVARVLDLGCGTGGHALVLAARGHEVVGVDRSEEMLAAARAKASSIARPPRFEQGDIRALDLQEPPFDATLMMFAVLSYQLENADVLAALRAARSHLRPGGVLVFDVWYGPAVLTQRPSERETRVKVPGGELVRRSSGELDTSRDRCAVRVETTELVGGRVVRTFGEEHVVRYFFPHELELFVEVAGLTLLRIAAFPDVDREPDEQTWNAVVVAGAPDR